jgi:hypothetical protein
VSLEVALFFETRRVSFEVARFFVTRRVSEEKSILTHASLTRRVTIFQWLSRKRDFRTDVSGYDFSMAQPISRLQSWRVGYDLPVTRLKSQLQKAKPGVVSKGDEP